MVALETRALVSPFLCSWAFGSLPHCRRKSYDFSVRFWVLCWPLPAHSSRTSRDSREFMNLLVHFWASPEYLLSLLLPILNPYACYNARLCYHLLQEGFPRHSDQDVSTYMDQQCCSCSGHLCSILNCVHPAPSHTYGGLNGLCEPGFEAGVFEEWKTCKTA